MDGVQIGGLIRAMTPAAVAIGGLYGLDSAMLTTVLTTLAALVVAIWSLWAHSQTQMIAAVNNADNGVKVVAASTVAPVASQPIVKESGK